MNQAPRREELEAQIKILQEEVAKLNEINKAFQKSEKEKNILLNGISKIVIFLDPNRRIVWANRAAVENTNNSEAELPGVFCYEFWHQSADPCHRCPISNVFNSSQDGMAEIETPNGKSWSIKAFPIHGEDGEMVGVLEIAEEITDQKHTREALRESLEKYKTVLETIEEGYFETDLDGNFLFINDAFCNLTTYTKAQLLGNNYRLFTPSDTAEKIANAYKEVYKTGKLSKLMAYKYITGNGTLKSYEQSFSIMRDHQNKPVGFRGVIRDISDRVHAEQEKKKLQDHLKHVQKMQAIGTLAGGIAHDFNNLLMGIQGNTSLMLMDIDEGSPQYERLINIEKHIQSGAELTGQLLGFARGGKYEIRTTDVNELVRKTCRMFGRTKKEIVIDKNLQKDICSVEADRGQLEQVLLNLYVNAWQAMPGGGRLYIQTESLMIQKDDVRGHNLKPGRYVKILVEDTGVGMDEATLERIFEPFFTTKEMGRGTGLGLASAYGIIRSHGGIIDVESEEGAGARFTIYLPASSKGIQENRKPRYRLIQGSETILLVDDEDMILYIAGEMLERMGYTVLTAKNGKSAIEVYRQNAGNIDLVILDMVMPGMSGGNTYDNLKRINPDVKVLLSSGYSIEGRAADILKHGCNAFIQKPSKMEQLSMRIREILDTKESN